jgi:uncharacterized protein YjgD (DUF1641 family)
MATTVDQLATLEQKLDDLADQVRLVAEAQRMEQLRRAQWDELRKDLTPVAGEAFAAVSRELDEVRDFVEPSDLWSLAKRVARNTQNIERMLGQLESISELSGDLAPLGRDMMLTLMTRLDEFERRGYVAFAKSGAGVLDRIVTSFSEEDVEALGDNIVLILQTVKEMTQPEVMRLLQRTAAGVRDSEVEEIGLLKAMWRMRNPAVRRGLSRVLKVLESFSDLEPATLEEPHTTDTEPGGTE